MLRRSLHSKPQGMKTRNKAHYMNMRWLAYIMAFIGGAINAGGFFAVARYTSHMSGELARIADYLFTSDWSMVSISALMVISFIIGSGHAALSILLAQSLHMRSSYAITLWVEAIYMLIFGAVAAYIPTDTHLIPIIVLLMCFIMGMHNTVMSMLSGGVMRSTHMTGFVTDIGIELAKWMFQYIRPSSKRTQKVNIAKLRLSGGLVISFVTGGVFGAWGFHHLNYRFVWPLSLLLLLLGLSSLWFELKLRHRFWQRHKHTPKS